LFDQSLQKLAPRRQALHHLGERIQLLHHLNGLLARGEANRAPQTPGTIVNKARKLYFFKASAVLTSTKIAASLSSSQDWGQLVYKETQMS
jgi:hypothetical protein